MTQPIAVYPGSFDPITKGHIDIIERCHSLFQKLYILVTESKKKSYSFSIEERIDLVNSCVSHFDNIEVCSFQGLTVEFVQQTKANFIIRGLRSGSDFEYEQAMASMNKNLYSDAETILIYARQDLSSVSSSLIKEVASYGGDVSPFVPTVVADALKNKFRGEYVK